MAKTKRKPTKAELEAEANWAKLNAKWDKLPKFARKPHEESHCEPVQSLPYRKTAAHKSKGYAPGEGTKREAMRYTGDKVLGVAVMHKSSMVPVFSQDEAIDIAKMRRG